jgi:hypothetical protein
MVTLEVLILSGETKIQQVKFVCGIFTPYYILQLYVTMYVAYVMELLQSVQNLEYQLERPLPGTIVWV